jgi:antitoxin PrlF
MPMPPTSRITSKGQITIPREVRERLSLQPGDVVVYDLEDGDVRLRKQAPLDVAYLRAVQTTLSEWDSPEDAAAFDDL